MPPIGLQQAARAVAVSAGKGPLAMSEEFALEKILGHRGAVDLDQRHIPPPALGVQGLRRQFLAGTRFTGHQHRRVDLADILDQAVNALHDMADPDKAVKLFPQSGMTLRQFDADIPGDNDRTVEFLHRILQRSGIEADHPDCAVRPVAFDLVFAYDPAFPDHPARILETGKAHLPRQGLEVMHLAFLHLGDPFPGRVVDLDYVHVLIDGDDGIAHRAENHLQIMPVFFIFQLQGLFLLLELPVFQRLPDNAQQGFLVDRLGDIVEGPVAHRLGGRFQVGKTGYHHHRTLDAGLLDMPQQICAAGALQDDIADDQVKLFLIDGDEGLLHAWRPW